MALVISNGDGTLLAYRYECPACGAALHDGALYGPNLECPGCELHYDLTRAGRALDGPGQLGPVPLLRDGDPELRPTGTRIVWLNGFRLPGELWTAFGIPVGLAFLMRSSATGSVV